jgi:AraC family transcriptional regulator
VTTQNNLYLQRINLVLNHIRTHLSDDLSVNTLARVASFSPFHFHRIFKTITGETLNDVVLRLRVERAVALMKSAPQMSIREAALAAGFTSSPVFTRAFKKQYSISPRQWNRQSPLKESKNGQLIEGLPYYTIESLSEIELTKVYHVHLQAVPAQRLTYIRVFNSYQPEPILSAYKRLIAWYQARGGQLTHTTLYGMSQDDPDITPLPLCRFNWALSVPQDWVLDEHVDEWCMPSCHIAYIHCAGDIFEVDRVWQYLYRYWLPRSRFQPDNLPAMEIYHRQPIDIGWERFDLKCAVPVVAL